ncbi:hypothetical protein [Crocinitomix algicola]|uniref:hypothetical protein n=1 Tax=Crocinitomix algicola TaxID=1740263 RepID=UPI0008364F79|nr:hypothetical protein [Crocinitomix algicola]
MYKKTFTIFAVIVVSATSFGQLGNLKNQLKEKSSTVLKTDGSSTSKKPKIITPEEYAKEVYSFEDRILKVDNNQAIIKGLYKKDFEDRVGLSGFYYLNTVFSKTPSSHFSSDTTKMYSGFSINYSPDTYDMQVHFSSEDSNYAVILKEYQKSADKGNMNFQFGIQGGPQEIFNAKCLVLEPGVILFGAYVYHKNDEVGHQWMNDYEPEAFYIAAKDTSKFKEYQANPEYTSQVVFEKFDRLRETKLGQDIAEAKPLPKEGMTNSKLKAEALSLIKKTADAYQWKEEVEYAYIVSTDWEIKRYPITGIPMKRIVKAIVVMKTPKGNYKREGFYIAQDYLENNTYGNTYMLYNDQRIYYVNPNDAFTYK